MNTALITGASSGIGRAITLQLLDKGYRVIGLSRTIQQSDIQSERFTPVAVDLADLQALAERLPVLAKEHPDINALICCAGSGRFGSLEEFNYSQISALMDLNFTSQAYVTRAWLPAMKRSGSGDIIYIGSEAALSGEKKGALYCASKFALRGMAQALRDECSRNGVRVTIINPGMVKTAFFDELNFEPGASAENYIEPDDVANAVAMVLDARRETVFDEINLSPLKKVIQNKPKQ
jgi:3-hydroxy acid dehydrogenase/malonic semialdehyde reductase